MKHKPLRIKESERFLSDCGFSWDNCVDLCRIANKNPDIQDICFDIINWIMEN